MKILLTHRFFVPDTAPYGLMLHRIGEALAEEGHEVHVFSTVPSYRDCWETVRRRERIGGVNVHRLRVFKQEKTHPLRRIINAGWYCAGLVAEIIRLKPEVVTASTFPPVLAAWAASLAARVTGARFIYHVQDIHPEISLYSGGRLGKGFAGRVLRWLDNQTLRRSDVIITLSEDMARTLRERGLKDLPIHVLNNPPLDADLEATPPPELRKPPGKKRVIFAGNLGRFQNLGLMAEGIARCFDRHPNLELMFLGEGVALEELLSKWGAHPQVRFGPFLPFAQAQALIAEADVGLVSLSPNIYKVAYPSKLATYLDLGLKVLACVEPESQLAKDLETAHRGTAPENLTAEAISRAMERLLIMPPLKHPPIINGFAKEMGDWCGSFYKAIT